MPADATCSRRTATTRPGRRPPAPCEPDPAYLARVREWQSLYVRRHAHRHGLDPADYVARSERHLAGLIGRAHPWTTLWGWQLALVLAAGHFMNRFERTEGGRYAEPAPGQLSPDYVWATRFRAVQERAECAFFGIPPAAPGRERPLYGYLAEDPDGRLRDRRFRDGVFPVSGRAAPIAVRLSRRVVRRATFTFGDSMDGTRAATRPRVAPAPCVAPDYRAVDAEDYDPLRLAAVDAVIPYVELQIFGGLTLDDVVEVVADEPLAEPIAMSVRAKLKRLGIPWRAAGGS